MTPQELIAQPDVDGMLSEPDPKVCCAEVCPVDDAERTTIQRQLRADSGNVGERVAVARFDVPVERVDSVETRTQRREGLRVDVLRKDLVTCSSEVRTANAPEVTQLEAPGCVGKHITGRGSVTQVQRRDVRFDEEFVAQEPDALESHGDLAGPILIREVHALELRRRARLHRQRNDDERPDDNPHQAWERGTLVVHAINSCIRCLRKSNTASRSRRTIEPATRSPSAPKGRR